MDGSIWADTPPTKDGWYWIQNRDAIEEVILLRDGRFYWRGDWIRTAELVELRFGPRCPSAEELAIPKSSHRVSVAELAELSAQLREAWGMPPNKETP